jgi:hypothetical protein
MMHVRRGDFAAAWAVSDRILQQRVAQREDCSGWPRHLQFLWDGRPLAGKRVLVHCYHGLGDTIQFVRLLGALRERVAQVTLWVQPALLDLLRSVRGIDRLIPLHDGAPDVERDVDIELMELPHAMRLTLDRIPRDVPYIHAPHVPSAVSDELHRVGVVWRSGDWVAQRSMPERHLARFGDVGGIQWCSLQYPSRPLPFAAIDLAHKDICVMAARMRALDLVIAVDTMTAHLAGALGLPVWTLLHDECDWRWMSERSDSPWYPTMLLFRQRAGGGWDSLIDDVIQALRIRTGQAPGRSAQPSQDSRARYSLRRL